jgi:precorrin-6B methylase 2
MSRFEVGDLLRYAGETHGFIKVESIREVDGEIRYYEDSRNIYALENDPDVKLEKVNLTEMGYVHIETVKEWLYTNFFEYEDNSYFGGGYVKLESVFDTFEEMIECFNRTVEG